MKTYTSKLITAMILVLVSCAPITPNTETKSIPTGTFAPAATSYSTPVSNGTTFPLLHEKIAPEAIQNLSLIARWEFDFLPEEIVFALDRDVICMRAKDGIQSWDVFYGDVKFASEYCYDALANRSLGTKLLSSGNQYALKVSQGALEVLNLLRPSTGLYFYLDGIAAAGFSAHGEYIAIAFQNGLVWFVPKSLWEERLLSLEDEHTYYDPDLKPELIIDVGKAPNRIAFSPDNVLLAFLFDDQSLQLWTVSSLSLRSTIPGFALPVSDMGWEVDALGTGDEPLEQNNIEVEKIAFSADNLIVATSSTDNQIRLWDTQTGLLLTKFGGDYHHSAILFSPSGRMLASLHDGNEVDIWGLLPQNADIAKASSTAIAEDMLTFSPTVSSFPGPTATPSSALPDYLTEIPLAWPVSMPTKQQIAEVRNCLIESLAESRYPDTMSYWEIENVYLPKSPCDWAVLAFAYRSHLDDQDPTPEEGKRAFFQAVRQNPAFAMTTSLFFPYFNSMELVDAPPSAKQPITSIVVDYEWSGIGEPSYIQYHVEIDKANSSIDKIKLNLQAQPENLTSNLALTIEPQKIQEISRALTDFLPVQSPFALQNCTDNYPDWTIKLTFLDGITQTVKTNGSNLFNAGGPWFIELDGQDYVQFSSALVIAASDLFEALGLPLGEPYAMFCSSVATFDMAFP